MEPDQYTFDIAVDRCGRPIEGNSGNCGRAVGPDPGQLAQHRRVFGKDAVMPLDDGARAGVQVAGACVIAEPLPELQDLVERCRGERCNIGPARYETVEIRTDSRYGCLLQHDFAEPDAVRVGTGAGERPPRQDAAMPVVP